MRSSLRRWVFAAPCTAIAYTGYHLAETGRAPVSVLPSTYLFFVLLLLGSGAILYYLLHMRVLWLRAAGDRVAEQSAKRTAFPSANSADRASVQGTAEVETGTAVNGEIAEQSGPEPRTRFLQRLPSEMGSDVLYLKASGHYIEAVTSAGSAIIMMRFTDAASELDTRGIRIHRSYWAAYQHITGLRRRDRRTLLCLTGGHELPISRSLVAAVRNAIEERTEH